MTSLAGRLLQFLTSHPSLASELIAHDVLLDVPLCLSFPASTVFSRWRGQCDAVTSSKAKLRGLGSTQMGYFLPPGPFSSSSSFHMSYHDWLSIYYVPGLKQGRPLPLQHRRGSRD